MEMDDMSLSYWNKEPGHSMEKQLLSMHEVVTLPVILTEAYVNKLSSTLSKIKSLKIDF